MEARLGMPTRWLDSPSPAASAVPGPPSLEEALRVVVEAITESPPARWPSVRAQFDQVASHPERIEEVLAELLELLRRRDVPAKPARAA
mgnify:CR=1 FL=1